MIKLKSLTHLNNKVLLLACIYFAFSVNEKLIAQTKDYSHDSLIKTYLEKSDKDFFPTISLDRVEKMRKDQTFMSNTKENIMFRKEKLNLVISKYKLKGTYIFEIGKGKVNNDSVYYFSIPGQIAEYYKIKKKCSIKFLGYNYYKYLIGHQPKVNFTIFFLLQSTRGNMCFSLNIGKLNMVLGQYDRI